ncbi:MAG TPA: O-antigen ligase family protein [Nocardioidaceae bacterium]|nr:O-antigen ligase family protein [Nocardioidaceae bacterium]
MRALTYRLLLVMVFTLPWEGVLDLPGASSLSKLVGLLVAAAWVIAVVVSGRLREPHLVHVLGLLFVLWNACSLIWTTDGPATQERVLTYVQLLGLTLVIWDTVTTLGALTKALLAYLAGCYVTAVALLVSYASMDPTAGAGDRVTVGTFHPNDVAMIVALGVPVAAYLVVTPGSGRWRFLLVSFGVLYLPLAGFAVLVTGSRTGIAALLPGIVFLGYRLARRRPALAVAALGALAGLAVAAFPFAPDHVRTRLGETEAAIQSGDLNERGAVWAEAIRLIVDHPLHGVGAGAFRGAAVGVNKVGHNFALSLLAEVGVIGFALFIGILIAAFACLPRMTPQLRGMWLALFSAWMLAALLHNWEYRKQTWFFIGLMVASGFLAEVRRHDDERDHDGASFLGAPR